MSQKHGMKAEVLEVDIIIYGLALPNNTYDLVIDVEDIEAKGQGH